MSRDLLIRRVRAGAEFEDFLNVSEQTFGDTTDDESIKALRPVLRAERCHGAFDDGALIATAAAYDFTLTVPGGEAAAAGVTMVGVMPTHRRRGILRELMRVQLDDVRERGEPLAVLWASESGIYGRFGYGLATRSASIDADRGITLRPSSGGEARIDLVSPDDAHELVAPVYDRVRRDIPGFFVRTDAWWRSFCLADSERHREGAGPLFVAVLQIDGEVEGYARYRIRSKWDDGIPAGVLEVAEALATTPHATRELWRFLLGVDLVARVKCSLPLDHALFHMTPDFRRLRAGIGDGMYVRIVDVEAALAARSYAADERVVVELRDEFCPWNAGRWSLSPDGAEPTKARAEIELAAEDFGAVYLGGTTLGELARAGRVREHAAGAIARADALLHTDRAPWCPEVF